MSVADLLNSNGSTAFSFELLPPVRGKGIDELYKGVERLMPYNPAYINITTHRDEVVYRELPDQRTIFRIAELLDFGAIGISLTENGAMSPQSSVCGLYLASPHAKNFVV